ncbi:MAG: hypothetical protein AAF694_22940 [Bacteroidota bacterium]
MLGIWEICIILSLLGWLMYSYATKKTANLPKSSRRQTLEDSEEVIDLDENSFEILDEDTP